MEVYPGSQGEPEAASNSDAPALTDHELALQSFGFDPSELSPDQQEDFLRRLGEPGNMDF